MKDLRVSNAMMWSYNEVIPSLLEQNSRISSKTRLCGGHWSVCVELSGKKINLDVLLKEVRTRAPDSSDGVATSAEVKVPSDVRREIITVT